MIDTTARAAAGLVLTVDGHAVPGAAEVYRRLGADPAADAVWAGAVDTLADGLVIASAGLPDPLREAMAGRPRLVAPRELRCAQFGGRAGVVGPAMCAFEPRPVRGAA